MDEVYQEVGEEDEDRKLQIVVERKGSIAESVVEFGVALDFEGEESGSEKRHERHRCVCLLDLLLDLVLEVFRVVKCGFVEYENIR